MRVGGVDHWVVDSISRAPLGRAWPVATLSGDSPLALVLGPSLVRSAHVEVRASVLDHRLRRLRLRLLGRSRLVQGACSLASGLLLLLHQLRVLLDLLGRRQVEVVYYVGDVRDATGLGVATCTLSWHNCSISTGCCQLLLLTQ